MDVTEGVRVIDPVSVGEGVEERDALWVMLCVAA